MYVLDTGISPRLEEFGDRASLAGFTSDDEVRDDKRVSNFRLFERIETVTALLLLESSAVRRRFILFGFIDQ